MLRFGILALLLMVVACAATPSRDVTERHCQRVPSTGSHLPEEKCHRHARKSSEDTEGAERPPGHREANILYDQI